MAASGTIQIKIDRETRKAAESLFDALGLDITTAIRLFLKQAVNQQRIPFEIVTPPPSAMVSQMNALAAAGKMNREMDDALLAGTNGEGTED